MGGSARSNDPLATALRQAPPRPFRGTAYRFVGTRFIDSPLSSAGSRQRGGRFNPPGRMEVLYAALSADTAMAEREGLLLTAPGIRLATQVGTGVLLRLTCRLAGVLDLTNSATREALGLSLATLLGPWLPWNAIGAGDEWNPEVNLAPTQRLGIAAHDSNRFEAILAPSAKDPSGLCLAIFVDRLSSGSKVDVDDPRGRIRATLGL